MKEMLEINNAKCRLFLICFMLVAGLLLLRATNFRTTRDIVVVHTDTPKSSTKSSPPRRAPMQKSTKNVCFEFLQDADGVIIVVKEAGLVSETYYVGNVFSGYEYPIGISSYSGGAAIEVYVEGELVKLFTF